MSNRPNRKKTRTQTAAKRRAAAAQAQEAKWKTIYTIAAAVGVLAVLIAVVAVILTSGGDDEIDPADRLAFGTEEPLRINGASLPSADGATLASDDGIGEKAPIVFTADIDGLPVFFGGGAGPNDTAKVVGFFAHWCPVCQEELPEISEALQSMEIPAGVEVAAVATGIDEGQDNYPPSDWFAETEFPGLVVLDSEDDAIADAFGLTGYPLWVVMDNNNVVLGRISGQITPDQLQEMVDLAASSVPEPAEAEGDADDESTDGS